MSVMSQFAILHNFGSLSILKCNKAYLLSVRIATLLKRQGLVKVQINVIEQGIWC